MDEIIDIVREALINKQALTSLQLKKIIYSFLTYYEISQYVQDVSIDYGAKVNHLAHYDLLNQVLYFNADAINEATFYNYNHDKEIYNLTFHEYTIIQNLITIFHELRHVMQYAIYCSETTDIMSLIIRDCQRNRLKEDEESYRKNYKINPLEREAYIYAIRLTLLIISRCHYFKKNVLTKLKSFYFLNLFDGYLPPDFSVCNLEKYYERVVHDLQCYYEFENHCNELSTYEKMSLGFPIDVNDRNNIFIANVLIDKEDIDYAINDKKKMKKHE